MTRAVLQALAAHWRRNPLQFFTFLAGLALATALWSGVQAINAEARASYDAAAATLGEGRFDQLVPRAGDSLPQETYVALRRAGWQVSPVVDPQTRQGIARIAIPYNKAIRPGGFASATITSGSDNAPLLPESAVQSDPNGSFVYIINGKNQVERRDVAVGQVSDAGVAITSGITGAEKIVTSAGAFLTPGQKVKPEMAKGR